MRPTKIFVVLAILFLTTTAVRADKVTFDYDHNVNFSRYRTFMWMQEPDTPDPFMRDRIVKSINAQLAARGLRLVTSKPDLVIGAGLATEEKEVVETYYTGDGVGTVVVGRRQKCVPICWNFNRGPDRLTDQKGHLARRGSGQNFS